MIRHGKPSSKASLWGILVVFALACVLVLPGCSTSQSSSSDKVAIEAVMNQATDAMAAFTNSASTAFKNNPIKAALSRELSRDCQQCADRLAAIDISKCPEDFRTAFVTFYQSVQSLKTYSDATTGWRGVLKGLLNPAAVFRVPDNTDKAMTPVIEAEKRLELVCTKYNVDIK